MLVVIGDKISRMRGNMTQEDLAKKAKVSRNIVSNIEQGLNYTMKNLVKVLGALGADDSEIGTEETVEAHRLLHGAVQEMLQGTENWATITRINIQALYREFTDEKKER